MKVRIYTEEQIQALIISLSRVEYSIAKGCIDMLNASQVIDVKDKPDADKDINKVVKSG